MLHGLRKWLAVRSYARRLGPRLCERYGYRPAYTPAQVRRTLADEGFSTDFGCYALALFCDRVAFDADHRDHGTACDYDAMRGEVADRFFEGNATFDACQVIDGSASGEGDFGDWDCGGDGASGDGGGSDGGCSDGGGDSGGGD